MRYCIAVTIVFTVLFGTVIVSGRLPYQFIEDFNLYPNGSSGEPNWEVTHIGFEVKNKAMWAEVPEGRGFAILNAVPFGSVVKVEASLEVHRSINSSWKIAGIGIYLNSRNFWHLALVESPDHQDKGHFAELAEMLDGVWNAHGETETKLTTLEETSKFNWQYNLKYRLCISLERDQIVGEIFEANKLLYRCVRRFDNRSVTIGRPMLTCGSFAASFDDVKIVVIEMAEEPKFPQHQHCPSCLFRPLAYLPSRVKATGYFRTEEIEGVYWLVDPNGYPTLSIGVDHVNYFVHWCEKLGYAPYHRNVSKKYGSEEAWAKSTTRRLMSWNFNVLGANNSLKTRYKGLAHTEFLSMGTEFASVADIVPKVHWTGFPDVFDQRFERFCRIKAKQICAPESDNFWLLGYFLDNELEWWGKSGRAWGIAEEAWKKKPDRACKQYLVQTLREFYQDDIDAFNNDFATSFQNFDAVLLDQQPKQPVTEMGQKALMTFVQSAAECYFRITTQAIRLYDPNHLILGCRFAWDVPDPVWEMAGKYCDIVTVNLYPRIDLEKGILLGAEEHLRKRFGLCKKPIIITEWSFPALDAKDSDGAFLPSKHGAGMRVDTQEQKAKCYAIFQRTVLSLPFVVGSHYFMWVDEPASGISSTFPEDSNYGLVNEVDEPYQELTETARKVNEQVFSLHGKMTAELSVKVDDENIVVQNKGKIPATFNIAQWVNGIKTEQRILLHPNKAHTIAFNTTRHKSLATYFFVICDAEDEVAELKKDDNFAEVIIPPEHFQSNSVCIAVCNPTSKSLQEVPVTITERLISDFVNQFGSNYIYVWQVSDDGDAIDIPFQVDKEVNGDLTLSILIPQLPAYSAVTLWLGRNGSKKGLLTGKSQVNDNFLSLSFERTPYGYKVANGALELLKHEPDGDAFDQIFLINTKDLSVGKRIELGSFVPLVWQVVSGQNLWVRPDRIESVKLIRQGNVCLVFDITFLKESNGSVNQQIITEVGTGGKFAPLKTQPQPFRCAFRFTFFPNQPFFLSQFLWLENLSDKPWQWKGYYHYLLSRIGGNSKDDEVGGAGVPNYWLPFASWRDRKLKIHYGATSLHEDERLNIYFWIDEGGNQHPDCYRRLDLKINPKERWHPKEPEPAISVFGVGEIDDNLHPWTSLVQTLRALEKVKVTIF